MERRLLGSNFHLVQRTQSQRLQSTHEDSTEGEEMRRQQKMKVMKGMTKKIRSKGRMDAARTDGGWLKCLATDC